MVVLTAVVVGFGCRSTEGDPDAIALLLTLTGLGAIGAIEFADHMGLF